MISIREVARLAGVSPATVSRVLNGTANVKKEKEELVRQVIAETGFEPNELARSLYKKSSKIIGLIIPSIENPFFGEMAKAIEKEAYEKGYRVLLFNTEGNMHKEIDTIRMMARMKADGIILMTTDEKIQLELEKNKIPVVVMDRQLPRYAGAVYIQSDHYTGGKMATKHLYDCGCRNIVNVRGPQSFSSARARYRGYLDACEELGISTQCVDCDYDYQDGLKTAEEIMQIFPEADGIIACNDMVAISIYKKYSKQGIQIPEQVQLIGFDGIELGHLMTPELTSIRQPISEMGIAAVHCLLEGIETGIQEAKDYNFPVELIQRETTYQW